MAPTYPIYAKEFQREDVPEGVTAIEIDPDQAYPVWLEKLGFPAASPTQAQLECARQCFTEYLHRLVRFARYMEQNFTDPAERAVIAKRPGIVDEKLYCAVEAKMLVKIKKGSGKWKLADFPEGKALYAPAEYARLKREGKVEL